MPMIPSSTDNVMLEAIRVELNLASINAYDDRENQTTHIVFMDSDFNPHRADLWRSEQNDIEVLRAKITEAMQG